MRSPRLCSWGSALLPALVAGCYTYAPLSTVEPVPETQLALVLSDVGRVGAGTSMGPGIARVEGALIGSTDSEYTLRIAGVTDIRGRESRWSGEQVSLRRTWVGNAYERRFSKPRTYLLVGALTAGLATFVVTRHLFGIGSLAESSGGGGGNQQ
ncbi:MAG TPA: hypothetical protein VN945_13110 [Gemmatimonadales bacterium]|nr:hypothetical protein [Gemmatimonadales bacterium]